MESEDIQKVLELILSVLSSSVLAGGLFTVL